MTLVGKINMLNIPSGVAVIDSNIDVPAGTVLKTISPDGQVTALPIEFNVDPGVPPSLYESPDKAWWAWLSRPAPARSCSRR